MNTTVTYGLKLIIMYQYWLINFNKWATLIQNIKCRETVRQEKMVYAQFFCKYKTAIKNKLPIKKRHTLRQVEFRSVYIWPKFKIVCF